MDNVRCRCGKIVCQVKRQMVVIKCRHCKRFIVINTRGLETSSNGSAKVEYITENV